MTDTTPRLGLGALIAAQSQKHVTVNEAFLQLDALQDCYLVSMALATPPTAPTDGDCYYVPSGATGVWANYTGKLAFCIDGGWRYIAPFRGLRAFNAADGKLYFHTGTAFTDMAALLSLPTTTEGTWTPFLTADTAPSDVSYSVQGGRYNKIGSLVFVQFGLTLSALGSGGAGSVQIGGLPYSVAAYDSGLAPAVACNAINLTAVGYAMRVRLRPVAGTRTLQIRLLDGNDTALEYSQLTTTTALAAELFYSV